MAIAVTPIGDDEGNIPFYVTFVVPIVLTLSVILVDISAWQSLRARAQREADRIALEAAQFLPDTDLAQTFITKAVLELPDFKARVENSPFASSTTVRVTLEGAQNSIFDSMLAAVSKEEVLFSVSETASAALVPRDTVLIVADAATLRPPARSAWGDAQEWKASSYFKFVRAPNLSIEPPPEEPLRWSEWWKEKEFKSSNYQRWATQLCFNPVFSSLKTAALSLADLLGSVEHNRLAVLFSPGDIAGGAGYSLSRELRFPLDQDAKVSWSNYYEFQSGSSDEACLYYAHPELSDERYQIPPTPTFAARQSEQSCLSDLERTPIGDARGHSPDPRYQRLSSCYRSGGAPVREAIYFRQARPHFHEADGENLIRAMEQAVAMLTSVTKQELERADSLRGNMSQHAGREVILLSDIIPNPSNARFVELRSRLDSQGVQLSIISFAHQGLGEGIQQEIEGHAKDLNSEKNSKLKVIVSRNQNELARELSSLISQGRKLKVRT